MNRKAAIGGIGLMLLCVGLPPFFHVEWAWGGVLSFSGLVLVIISCRDWIFGWRPTRLDLNQLKPDSHINPALIKTWRAMVTDVHTKVQKRGSKESVMKLLEAHPAFPSMRPYLSERSKGPLHSNILIVAPRGSTMDGLLHSILDDIERMEKDCGLR
jgi:hypothetical protein